MQPAPVTLSSRVGLWTSHLRAAPFEQVRDLAAEIDQLGYGSVWLPDSPLGEPFAIAALTLASTSRLAVGTGVANIWLRHAASMRSTAHVLTQAFPGRFVLGLGVSHAPLVNPLFPDAYTHPLAKMRDYLNLMDEPPRAGTPPSERPARVLGALADKMLALARDQADGAHPYNATPEHTKHARDILGPGKLLVPEMAAVLSTDRAVVLERARAYVSGYFRFDNYRRNWERLGFTDDDFAAGGSERLCDAVVAGGDVDLIRRRVAEHLEAGADHVVIQVLGERPGAMPMDEWRHLAPALKFE